jgi:hypothetical protein
MWLDMGKIFLENMSGRTIESIPKGNWLVKYDDQRGIFFLEETNTFKLPDIIYGDCQKYVDRYLNSYNEWDGNLGVLLSGLKGTGKSLLAKKICIDSDLPVIMIPHPYTGADFLSFLSKISQDCIIFLDEFEKIYQKEEHQNALLSILDGTFNSKFLFLLTINEQYRMTQYMMNRPSRIHYYKAYGGMEDDIILEICKDLLDDPNKIEDTLTVCTYLGEISMDILISLIKEINLYPEQTPMEVVEYMNLSPSNLTYSVDLMRNGILIKKDMYVYSSPLNTNKICLEWFGENIETMDDKDHDPKAHTWNDITMSVSLCSIKVKNGTIVVEYSDDKEETWEEHEPICRYVAVYKKRKAFKARYF